MLDIKAEFHDGEWLNGVVRKLSEKLPRSVSKARRLSYMPYSTQNGDWAKTDIDWWTNGFWPASMWQMYMMTGDPLYRE